MRRFTIPRVAHCKDGCRHTSWARRETAHEFFPLSAYLGFYLILIAGLRNQGW